MEYQSMYKVLANIATQAQEVATKLDEQLKINMQRFLGEYLQEENKRIDNEAKEKLAALQERAQQLLDDGIAGYQNELDKKYFADIQPNHVGELEMIANSNLDLAEMRAYFRKFRDNYPALRRLEKIAEDKGFLVIGKTYMNEMDFLDGVKNSGQGVVNAISGGTSTRLTIALNFMQGKVDGYNQLENKETQVLQK
ncbi:hypothetical protein [Candidatus Enterococcus courvalinii]|uniref:LXG domain-containing protein n=1 Tax=Candidatus Enterococcus courvalinii TaxID=2815329 RepID=A0ABS3HZC7_9ENTE|nr:hypothetical protein [Enterococcus sp. MSG2901]MBO0481817.1 hypothetical protein [Enterococcus sp. MSG2901]